jgi:hypothetical protein
VWVSAGDGNSRVAQEIQRAAEALGAVLPVSDWLAPTLQLFNVKADEEMLPSNSVAMLDSLRLLSHLLYGAGMSLLAMRRCCVHEILPGSAGLLVSFEASLPLVVTKHGHRH